MRKVRWLGLLGVVALGLSLFAASASGGKQGQKYTIGFVVHVKGNPFIQQIIDGARAAGKDLGVTVKVAGPEGFDADAQLKLVQDLVASGAQGITTSVAGESMVKGLSDIIKSGKPVATFNLTSHKLKAPYVGERSVASGRVLGKLVLNKMGGARKAKGKVIVGICAPGLQVLENRVKGIKQAFKGVKGVQVKGAFDVKVAANENYAAWEQLYSANPDVKAFIGTCAPDVASLGKLNKANGDKFIAGGYDTTAENLAAIKSGHAYVTLGQTPFVQGYLPVVMLVDALKSGKKLPQGFIESGTEVVTKAGAVEPYGLGKISFAKVVSLSKSPALTRTFYTPLLKSGKLKNWRARLEPIANEGK